MKEVLAFVFVVAFCALVYFINSIQLDDFQHCADEAAKRFPASEPVPEGQPFKAVFRCMAGQGYRQDNQLLSCRGLDYTRAVMNADCYRSGNAFMGFFHDIKSVFR